MKPLIILSTLLLITSLTSAQIVFEDGFETDNTDGVKPAGWYNSQTPKWMAGTGEQSHNRSPRTGNWYAWFPYNSNAWMFHEMPLVANQTYEFSMWYKTDGIAGFQLEIKWGTDTLPSAMSTTIQTLVAVNNTEYQQIQETFTPPASGTYYLGIHGISTNSPWYLSIDDVKLRMVNDYGLEVERINPDTIAFSGSWYDYRLKIKNTGINTDAYSLACQSGWNVVFYDKTATNQITSIPLTSYETDTIIVRQFVPETGISFGQIQASTITIASQNSQQSQNVLISTTAVCPISDFPVIQGFENTQTLPLGWQSKKITGNYAFQPLAMGENPSCLPHDNSSGMMYYRSFSAQTGSTAILCSPPLSFTAAKYVVRFWVYRTANISNRADKIQVYLADDANMTNAQMLGGVHRATNFEPVETTEGWFEYSYIFPTPGSTKYIVFKAVSDYGWNMYLDNVKINLNGPDTDAPELISISETAQYADLDMPVTVVVRDESPATPTVQGVYNVGNGNEFFEMSVVERSRGNYTFSGQIPGQPNNTTGTVWFVMSDMYDNMATSESYVVEWKGIAPIFEESFEGAFPPAGWNIISEPTTWFIWQQVGTEQYEDSDNNTFTVAPKHKQKQAMVGWDYQENPQDEWLISPAITISEPADLSFETFAQFGSLWYDHSTVGISTNGINWTVVWDAFLLNTWINQYEDKVVLPLDNYVGQTIYVAWRAYNTVYDNFWYSWFIDDVRIEKRDTVGIQEGTVASLFDFDILENPANGTIRVRFKNELRSGSTLVLYDIAGKMVKSLPKLSEINTEVEYQIDVSDLNAGVYICRFFNGENMVTKKVVVAK